MQHAVRGLVAYDPVAYKRVYFFAYHIKYTKKPNIVCVSYIIGCVHLNKNISDLWSL